jgi:hypothetical protein
MNGGCHRQNADGMVLEWERLRAAAHERQVGDFRRRLLRLPVHVFARLNADNSGFGQGGRELTGEYSRPGANIGDDVSGFGSKMCDALRRIAWSRAVISCRQPVIGAGIALPVRSHLPHSSNC